MEILLVRHAVADGQAGRLVGRSDPGLGDAGRAQATALAGTALAAPARIVSSDLARARETAALLAAPHGTAIAHDARLREMDFGAWDGLAFADIEARDGERFSAWMAEWWRAPAPGGESFAGVRARVAAWWAELLAAPGAGPVWVVAHGGSLRAVLCEVLGLPDERAFAVRLDHAGTTLVRWRDGRAEVGWVNGTGLAR